MDGYAATVSGRQLRYAEQLPDGESIFTMLSGNGSSPDDHTFTIENRKVRAGLRVTTDRRLAKLQFWSPRTTGCTEPFVNLKIGPGQPDRSSIRYEFYTLD